MLISIKISRNSAFLSSDKPRMLFFQLITVKMPTIVGILTFMSRKNFMLTWAEHEKCFITSGPGGRGQMLVLNNFQCRGVLHFWTIVGQKPIVLAVSAAWSCIDILFSLTYHISFLSSSLWETARYIGHLSPCWSVIFLRISGLSLLGGWRMRSQINIYFRRSLPRPSCSNQSKSIVNETLCCCVV